MDDDNRLVAESIEELLVALASGVREAQEALNEADPIDSFGRPMPAYHIPYLDFELGVDIETTRQSGGRPLLRLTNVRKSAGSSRSHRQTRSQISGRLVAIPPGEGLPIPVIRLTAGAIEDGQCQLYVELSNSAGEVLADTRVELNLDLAASERLTRANGGEFAGLRAGTRLVDAVLVSDETGLAQTRVSIDADERDKTIIVVTAQAGTTTASLSIEAGGGS